MKKFLFLALIGLAGGSMAAQDNRGISNNPLSSVAVIQDEAVSVGSTHTHSSASGSDASSSNPSYKAQRPLSFGTPSNDPLSMSAWQLKSTTSSTQR